MLVNSLSHSTSKVAGNVLRLGVTWKPHTWNLHLGSDILEKPPRGPEG